MSVITLNKHCGRQFKSLSVILKDPSCRCWENISEKKEIPILLWYTVCPHFLCTSNQHFPVSDWWVLIISHLGGRGCVSAYNWLCALPKHQSHLTAEWVKQIRLSGEKQPHLFPITPALLSWGIQLLSVHILHVYRFNVDCEASVYPSDPSLSHILWCVLSRKKNLDSWKQQARNCLKVSLCSFTVGN